MIRIPDRIREILGDRPYDTDRLGKSCAQVLCFDDMVLKIEPVNESSENEYRMMKWLDGKIPVPQIVCFVCEDGTNYLLMSRVDGAEACDEQYMTSSRRLARILADALKQLWSVEIGDCPSDRSLTEKLRKAENQVANKLYDLSNVEEETFGENGFKNPEELLEWLQENRPVEELVFSHGDFCLPNVIIKDEKVSGFIDLGNCGVADKYQDIALCYRSLCHNADGTYGNEYKGFDPKILFEELGMEPDWEKIKYYILLDELF